MEGRGKKRDVGRFDAAVQSRALNVASDWGYIEAHRATHLDGRLDEVCAITWCLGRRL